MGYLSQAPLIERLEALQKRLAILIEMLDETRVWGGNQYYVHPDWYFFWGEGTELRDSRSRDDWYADFAGWHFYDVEPEVAAEFLRDKRYLHWDYIRIYNFRASTPERRTKYNLSETAFPALNYEQHDLVQSGEFFLDPFSEEGAILGYLSNMGDYLLISKGPDGISDVLPFWQDRFGDYTMRQGASQVCNMGACQIWGQS